jgi:hypothetical protein
LADAQRGSRKAVSWQAGAMAALLATALTLAALEVGARIWLHVFADDAAFERYASWDDLVARLPQRLTPHRYLGYVTTPGYERGANRHDALGYRGADVPVPKPEGELRIVCLGGSTTYTPKVEDWRLPYPALLESVLKERHHEVRVINAGVPGWSSFESLLNLQLRVLDLEPDLVIVYHGINDIHPRLVWPPEAYRGDNSGRRGPVAADAGAHPIEASTLARILGLRGGWIRPHTDFTRSLDRAPSTYHGDVFYRQRHAGGYPDGIFREVSAKRMLAANPPVYFLRNLENIAILARAHGAQPVFATFAVSDAFDLPRVTSPEYRAAYA